MGGRKQLAGASPFISLLFIITACTGQKLNAVETNGVFFSGLPRAPSEINAITAKGADISGNTLGRGFLEKFTTPNPLKTGSTPFDFRFNSAKPDNRFASGPRTPSNFVTRPTFFTDSPPRPTAAPRVLVPTTSGPAPPPPPRPPAPFRPPTFAPTTPQSAPQRPTNFRPVTQRTTTLRPATLRPTTQRPTTERFTTQRPTTQRRTTQRPTTERLTTPRPTTQRPTTPRPTTLRLTTARLTTPRPTLPSQTTPRPTPQRPTTQRPVTQRPTVPGPVPSLRPTILQDLPPTPRLAFRPGTFQNTVSNGRQPTPFFPVITSPPPQRPTIAIFTTRQPTPFFPINSAPPPPVAERSFNAINTARPSVPVPTTTTRRRIFVPASALSSGTLPTTTTLRPPTRLATLNLGTAFSTFRPATRPTTPAPTGTGFLFCDQRQCVKMCREHFGEKLNSSTCLANACKCEVTQTCSPSLCLQMCRKNNPAQEIISAGCQGENCRCALNQPCEPAECRRQCLLAHGDKLISADCAVRNACQCVHS